MFCSPHKSQFPAVRFPRRNLDMACCIVTAGVLYFPGVPVYDIGKEIDSAVQRYSFMIH
jgi:hypothetical protein